MGGTITASFPVEPRKCQLEKKTKLLHLPVKAKSGTNPDLSFAAFTVEKALLVVALDCFPNTTILNSF
jgi:hypothetical protein